MDSQQLPDAIRELHAALVKAKVLLGVSCLQARDLVRMVYGEFQDKEANKKLNRRKVDNIESRPARIRIPLARRRVMYNEQNGDCSICKQKLVTISLDVYNPMQLKSLQRKFERELLHLHVDHKNPNLTGDEFNARTNLALAHPKCNTSKGGRSIMQQSKRSGLPFTALV